MSSKLFPTQQELDILKQGLVGYFQMPKRSEERKTIVNSTALELAEINPQWNAINVRLWFNNNRNNYESEINGN